MLCSLEDSNTWFSKQKLMLYIIKYKAKVVSKNCVCNYWYHYPMIMRVTTWLSSPEPKTAQTNWSIGKLISISHASLVSRYMYTINWVSQVIFTQKVDSGRFQFSEIFFSINFAKIDIVKSIISLQRSFFWCILSEKLYMIYFVTCIWGYRFFLIYSTMFIIIDISH